MRHNRDYGLRTCFFDHAPLKFPCPRCGRQLQQTIGDARENRTIVCPGGHSVKVDGSQLDSETRKAEESMGRLFRK